MGQEDLQRGWRTSSRDLGVRRSSNRREDLQWIWRTSDGSGGPPTGLEDPKSGSMGQKVLQQPSKSSNTPLTTPLSLCLPPYSLPSTNLTGCTPGGAGPPRLLLHPEPIGVGGAVVFGDGVLPGVGGGRMVGGRSGGTFGGLPKPGGPQRIHLQPEQPRQRQRHRLEGREELQL